MYLVCPCCHQSSPEDEFEQVEDQKEDQCRCDYCGWEGTLSEAEEAESDGEFLCPSCHTWTNS